MQVEKYFKYGVKEGQKMGFTRYTVEENYFPPESNYPIESNKPSVGARDLK